MCLSVTAESWQPIRASPSHKAKCRRTWQEAQALSRADPAPFVDIPAPHPGDTGFTGPTLYVPSAPFKLRARDEILPLERHWHQPH